MQSLVAHIRTKVNYLNLVSGGRKTGNSVADSTSGSKCSMPSWLRSYSSRRTSTAIKSSYKSLSSTNTLSKLNLANSRNLQFTRAITRPHIALHQGQTRRTMFIRTESTPNPDSMKFMPDKQLLEPGQSIDFENAMAAARSPLAKVLFRNDCVRRVFIGSSFVTVTKDEEIEWDSVKPLIFADLMEFFSSGEEVLLGEVPVSDTTILPDDSEDVALIKTLIETRIRPSIQDDGGDLTYRGFIDGVVFLQLQGSCTSCPSSSVTLKNGIEKMLKHWSSSVISVVAVESEEEWERIASAQPNSVSGTSASDVPSHPEVASVDATHSMADLNARPSKSSKTDDL